MKSNSHNLISKTSQQTKSCFDAHQCLRNQSPLKRKWRDSKIWLDTHLANSAVLDEISFTSSSKTKPPNISGGDAGPDDYRFDLRRRWFVATDDEETQWRSFFVFFFFSCWFSWPPVGQLRCISSIWTSSFQPSASSTYKFTSSWRADFSSSHVHVRLPTIFTPSHLLPRFIQTQRDDWKNRCSSGKKNFKKNPGAFQTLVRPQQDDGRDAFTVSSATFTEAE